MYDDNYKNNHRQSGSRSFNEVTSVKFRNKEKDILLRKPKIILTAKNCPVAYDRNLVNSKDIWHEIIVHKDQPCTKQQIELALLKAVNGKYFIPIRYQLGVDKISFYVIDQGSAIDELFRNNLKIKIDEEISLSLTIKLGVGYHEKGQIVPVAKISEAIKTRLKGMKQFELDLSNFKTCDEFFDMKFWIGIEENFEIFCDILTEVLTTEHFKAAKSRITQIDLSNNLLSSLKPLKDLEGFSSLVSINLTENRIEDVKELQHLGNFKLTRLRLNNNPLASDSEGVHKILPSILPQLIHCDIPKPLTISSLEPAQKRARISVEDENIPISDGGNIVTVNDINQEFKDNLENLKCIENVWTKVFIEHNGRVDSEKVLDEMFLQYFNNTPCYPCYYRKGDNEDFFYLYKNFEAIKVLVRNNLRLKIGEEIITLRLHLRCADHQQGHVKHHEDLLNVILSRSKSSSIDLKELQKDKRLKDIIVKLSTVAGLKFITDWLGRLSHTIKSQAVEIDLSGNGIRSLGCFEWLKKFPILKVLNLSNNQIESLIGLPKLPNILVFSLHHNPICKNYFHLPYRYVQTIMQFFVNLEYLDGHKIDKNFKLVTLKNYHCTPNAYNAVENFAEFFFKNYDGDRKYLGKIYTPNTIYCERYGAKTFQRYVGVSAIMSHVLNIPQTSHDLINTSIDVSLFNPKNIQIVISGILKIKEELYTYTRTIMLTSYGQRAIGTLSNTFYFYITNEIFLLDDIRDSIIRNRAFKSKPASLEDFQKAYEGLFTEEEVKNAKISLLQQITKLKIKYCKRFLEDASENVMDALQYFNNFYQKRLLNQDDFEGLKGQ